jgi:hypothetical protein
MTLEKFLIKFNPTLPKVWLLMIAGVMWTGVSFMLLNYAITWLVNPFVLANLWLGLLGVAISIAANYFQFWKLAGKNVDRILALNDRACLFSFQAWKGYLIIAVMVTGGILLRNSSIPKPYLAVVYAGIGGALLQASIRYYSSFIRVIRTNRD